MSNPRQTSWIVRFAVCKDCDYNLIITQPDWDAEESGDYWWYCSNKKCGNHHPGEQIGDMEDCSFGKDVR